MDRQSHLIENELPGLRRYACAMACDAETAASLVQATVSTAQEIWEHRGPDLRLWLFTILRNRACERGTKGPWQPVTGRGVTVDDRSLDERICDLTQDQREIVALVCSEGWSYRDVASLTSLPVGTVLCSLTRARRALRLAVKEQGL